MCSAMQAGRRAGDQLFVLVLHKCSSRVRSFSGTVTALSTEMDSEWRDDQECGTGVTGTELSGLPSTSTGIAVLAGTTAAGSEFLPFSVRNGIVTQHGLLFLSRVS